MFKLIASIVLVVLVVVLIYAATQPDTINVQRTASINAPPERIFPLLSDFNRTSWGAWSPYELKDPDMQRTLSGSPNGVGAVYEWQGDKNIGQGRMEITSVTVPTRVTIRLDFIKPLEGHNITEFTLQPQAETTLVTWTMHGPATYLSKLIGVFLNMDRMIGTDFEAGLSKLKAIAEQAS
jgi:hypothetical protein